MDIAHQAARRSNCSRRQVAAVIVREHRLITTGYNGTPRGVPNCFEGGCPRCAGDSQSGSGLDTCLCSHAEENAIVQAAYHGVSVRDGTLYCTISPCLLCAKMIINAGIKEVVFEEDYHFSEEARQLFEAGGVHFRQFMRGEKSHPGESDEAH